MALPKPSRDVFAQARESFLAYKDLLPKIAGILFCFLFISNALQFYTRSLIAQKASFITIAGLIFGIVALYMFAYGCVIQHSYASLAHENPDLRESCKKGLKRSLQLLLGMLLIFMLMSVLPSSLLVLLALIKSPMVLNILYIAIFLFLVLYYFYMVVSLITYPCCIILDNKSFIAAMVESFKLIEQNWWRTFAVILIVFLIPLLFLGIVQAYINVFNVAENPWFTTIGIIGLESILQTLIIPIGIANMLVIWVNLKSNIVE